MPSRRRPALHRLSWPPSVGAGVPDGPLKHTSCAARIPHNRTIPHGGANVPPPFSFICGLFRAPARVTFGRSPKSDQKDSLTPAVSRLPPRPVYRTAMGYIPHERNKSQTTRNVELTHFSERCRFYPEMQGAPFYRFGDYQIAHLPPKAASVGTARWAVAILFAP